MARPFSRLDAVKNKHAWPGNAGGLPGGLGRFGRRGVAEDVERVCSYQ